MGQQPSIGQIVHYVAHGTPIREDGTQAFPPACRAAIITEVGEYPDGISNADRSQIAVPVGLAVLNPTGMFFHQGAMQSELGHEGGSWHWPERVEG